MDANIALIRALLSGLRTLAAFVGPDGRIADYNEAYAEFFGLLDRAEGLGPTGDGLEPRWLAAAAEGGALDSVRRGETIRYECELIGARGAAWFDVSLIPFLSEANDVVGILLSASRVTPAVESAWPDSMAHALDAVADGIVLFDAHDKLVYANSRMREAQSGISEVFAPGTPFREFACAFARSDPALTGESDLDAWYERRLARHRDPGEPFEFRLADKWFLCREHRTSDGGTLCIYTDISETKRAQEALRDNERLFRDLAEASFDAVFVQRGTTIVDANAKAERLYGWTKAELIGIDVDALITPVARPKSAEMPARTSSTTYETHNVRKDGTVFPVEISARKFSALGEDIRVVAIRDMSARRRDEEALRESEERYRRLVEISPDAIRIVSGGTVVLANEAAVRLYGAESSSELVGRDALDFISPDDHDSIVRLRQGFDEGDSVSRAELTARRVDGSLLDVEASAARIVWRGRESQLIVSRDVSARKRADEALRLRERAIAASLNGILFTDAQQSDHPIVYVNPAFEELTGYRAADVIGRNCRFLQNDDRDQPDIAKIRDAIAASQPVRAVLRNYRKDGSRFWNELRLAPVRDANGRLTHYIGVQTDVTERIEGESTLRRAVAEAEQANLAKTRFLAAASHDLRQPIHALNMLNQLLVEKATDNAVSGIAGKMGSAIAAMTSVLDALMDISRLEAGVIEPIASDFAVDEILNRLVGEFGPDAEAKGIDLVVVRNGAFVRTDRNLLDRIVQNFVSNALRYTEKGRVLVGCRRRGDGLRIQVWDTGIGIAEDQIDGIFEEFRQLDNPERDRAKGLGLGLAIVDRIARLLAHPIEFRSSLGRGSMFSVTVPLGSGDEGRDVDDTAADRVLDLSGKSILIVEDNLEVGEATKALVEFWRADVTWAVNAEEALTLISDGELRPDMVIADYRLPDGDTGIDMLRRIAEVVGPGCHESSSPAIHHRSSPARRAKSARCSCTSRSIPRTSAC